MPKIVELSYSKLLKYTMKAVNPFKNALVTTECIVHKVINNQALLILKNDNKIHQYKLLSNYIGELNLGVVWADQDLKSSGHFYNPYKGRGLYGNTDALTLAKNYYKFAISCWAAGNVEKSMVFLGASAHLVQDLTVPQHANIKLLKEHHKYEKFVRDTFYDNIEYFVNDKGFYHYSVEELIKHNALNSIKANKRLSCIKDEEERYYELTKYILPLAQRSTAGLFDTFYRQVNVNDDRAYREI